MLYVQEKVVKLGGIYLEGQVTSVEVQEAGSVYVAQDEKGRYKKSQPVGYENAKVMIDILLEDTKTATTLEQLTEMQRLFKPYGQDKPKLLPIVNEDFDSLIDGYVRCGDTDYWKEIMIKDDMMKLDRVTIKASFVDCEPQDVIRYVLACAGIEDYVLSDEHYGKKDLFVIDRKSGINTIAEVNSSWGIKNPFFFQKKVFYWGTKEEQKEIYVLEEGETILSLNKYGDLWEAETIAIPWIHHSQEVEVQHSKYSGIVTVEKTIVRSDDTGAVHMYIYFAGGEKDV